MVRLSDTREQIMDRAAQLLMSRGFNGFSYRDISSHLGVKNAAVHYHFPSKADLALALVREYRELLRKNTAVFMLDGGSATEQMEGFFLFTSHQCRMGRCICPFGAFSIDYEDLPNGVKKAMNSFMEETIQWLTKVLDLGREQKEFAFAGEPGPKALTILSTLQGARQIARMHGMEILDQVVTQVRTDLSMKS